VALECLEMSDELDINSLYREHGPFVAGLADAEGRFRLFPSSHERGPEFT